jgi:DNA-binding beta-propeller fold protein YncE
MAELEQLQHERDIADLIRQTPGDWQEIRVHVCANTVTFGITVKADVRLPRGPRRLSPPIVELRQSMVDPQRGAWLMADVVVPRAGEATFSYDWMSKPDWPATGGKFSDFDDVGYLEDLKVFPRTADNIPDWYPTPETAAPAPDYADTDTERPPPPPPRRGDDAGALLDGLDLPFGVAVDANGNLYVTDADRVVTLAADAEQPAVLPFSGLGEPCGVAVDDSGVIYVADSVNNRVVALPAGGTRATELPFNGLHFPGGIAVDAAGALYVTDRTHRQVLKLPRGATEPTVLPFPGLRWLIDVAVDDAGAVYVADRALETTDPVGGRVLKLSVGADEPTELCNGLVFIGGIAVDTVGDLYITEKVDEGRVLKLAAGAFSIVAARLRSPSGVAVDEAGGVYVAEAPPESEAPFGGRVIKLAAS